MILEPFDQGEFPDANTRGGCGSCTYCSRPATWMGFTADSRRPGRVVSLSYCDVHGAPHAKHVNVEPHRPLMQRVTPPPSNSSGHVYYAERFGRIKIGWSSDVAQRMGTLKAVLLATEPGDRHLERQRHAQFSADRIVGEWFQASPALEAHIDTKRAAS